MSLLGCIIGGYFGNWSNEPSVRLETEWSFSERVTVNGEEYLKGIVLPGLRGKSSVTVEVRTVKAISVQDCGTVLRLSKCK